MVELGRVLDSAPRLHPQIYPIDEHASEKRTGQEPSEERRLADRVQEDMARIMAVLEAKHGLRHDET